MRLYQILLISLVFYSCQKQEQETFLDFPELMEIPEGFDAIEFPDDNAFTYVRWNLGKKLFYDPVMSVDSTLSCASCHLAELAFSDDKSTSPGVMNRPGTRNSPTLANIAYHPYFTREGGVPTLEMQVLVPIQEHNEFDFNILLIVDRLNNNQEYIEMSQAAYERNPDAFVITRALANFERSFISGNSRFDQYYYQGHTAQLDENERNGMELFFSERTNCATCHGGFNFSNYTFENNGLYEEYADPGRFRLTQAELDRALFKVPSLRNIEITGPYMHDGSINSLEEVVRHYNAGGADHPHKSTLIRALNLSKKEQSDLVDFLKSLTDNSFIENPILKLELCLFKNIFLSLLLLGIIACNKDDDDMMGTEAVYDDTPYVLEHGALPAPTLPIDNQLTRQGVLLGKMLFYDKKLSKDLTQACADCHRQPDGFSDSTRFSIGVEGLPGKRQAMPVFNMAWHTNEFFWDGRAPLLRDQALKPIQDPLEMNETLENVIAKLSAEQEYNDQFIRAFGDDSITEERMALAMEQFMLSIVSYNSKYDKFLAGEIQLTESEERGRELFFQEFNPFFPDQSGADCAHCHGGANFENDRYMNNGLDEESDFDDIGREAVTEDPNDRAKFKVPSLRNVALTAPYMHDGRFQTLEEVVDHYNSGIKPSSTADPTVINTMDTGLMLTDQDKTDLVNFLKTLTDEVFMNNSEYQSPF